MVKHWRKIILGITLVLALVLGLADLPGGYPSKSASAIEAKEEKSLTLTDDNFQATVLESTELVMVDFWAEWCGPCHELAPVVEEIAIDYEGRVVVGKLHVDDNADITIDYGIRSLPTLLFFKDGEVVHHVEGVAPRKVITDKLDSLLTEAVVES